VCHIVLVLVLVLDWSGKTVIGVMVLYVFPKSMVQFQQSSGEKRPLEHEDEHEHEDD
jgi:hypothetical protein